MCKCFLLELKEEKEEHKIPSSVKKIMLTSFFQKMCSFTKIREITLLLLKILAGQKLPL